MYASIITCDKVEMWKCPTFKIKLNIANSYLIFSPLLFYSIIKLFRLACEWVKQNNHENDSAMFVL